MGISPPQTALNGRPGAVMAAGIINVWGVGRGCAMDCLAQNGEEDREATCG